MLKRLLTQRHVNFEEIDVSGDFKKREWLVAASGQRTVPQLFIDGRPRGGYSDVVLLDRRGELDALLASASGDAV